MGRVTGSFLGVGSLASGSSFHPCPAWWLGCATLPSQSPSTPAHRAWNLESLLTRGALWDLAPPPSPAFPPCSHSVAQHQSLLHSPSSVLPASSSQTLAVLFPCVQNPPHSQLPCKFFSPPAVSGSFSCRLPFILYDPLRHHFFAETFPELPKLS